MKIFLIFFVPFSPQKNSELEDFIQKSTETVFISIFEFIGMCFELSSNNKTNPIRYDHSFFVNHPQYKKLSYGYRIACMSRISL